MTRVVKIVIVEEQEWLADSVMSEFLKSRAGVQQRREGCHGYSLGTALPAGMAGRRPDASELCWLSGV